MEGKMIKKFINKQNLLNILIFIVYSLILTFLVDWFSRADINESFSFLTNSFNIFLYNMLIISITLSPCFLFKRRIFSFSLISLIWLILGFANNLLMNFRETPLTFADIKMIKTGLELSNQYLSKGSILLIILLSLISILILILIFLKCKKTKINYLKILIYQF